VPQRDSELDSRRMFCAGNSCRIETLSLRDGSLVNPLRQRCFLEIAPIEAISVINNLNWTL
jgi:hypothetical protein